MKKRTLIVAALLAAMTISANAQENLAQGKTATASSEQQVASNAVDGNMDSRWEVKIGEEKQENGVVGDGSYWLYVDLAEAKEFNTIRIKWEGGYAKKFKVLVADELDETTKEPKWKDEAILTKEETLSDFTKYYTYFLNNAVTARYVKLQAEELGFAPYFSVYEMGIYNLTNAEKVSKIIKFKANKETLAPGDEFSVTVTDQFDQDITKSDDITYTCTNATEVSGEKGKFVAGSNGGEVTVTATDKQGNSQTVKLTAYAPVMTTVRVSPAIVVTGEETALTFTVKDQEGKDFTDYTTDVTDNKYTATEDGAHEITVTSNGKEEKVTVYAVSAGAETPTLGETDKAVFMDGTEGHATSDKTWNGRYDSQEVISLKDNKVLRVSNVGTFGINNASLTGETGYKSLNFDIFPTTDVEDAYVQYEGAGTNYQKLTFSLKAGEWNHVSLNVAGAENYANWIQINLGTADATNNPDILLDNVYLSTGNAVIEENVTVASEPNARGFYAVKGYAKSAETINAQLKDETIAAYDLTGLTTEGEGYTLTPANPNALIYVNAKSDKTGNDFEPAQDWGETKNVIGYNGNSAGEWYVPAKGIEYEDGKPVYTGFFISAKAGRPLSYTRTIPAKKYVSTYLPVGTTIPEGCTAYTLVAGTDDNHLNLEKAETLNAQTPYFIYNGNDSDVILTFSTESDANIAVENEQSSEIGNVVIKGNYSYFEGDGSQYVLDGTSYDAENGTLTVKKCTSKTKIVPFRTYFTLKDTTKANAVRFVLPGTVTGINDVKANAQKAADIYSVDGRLVKKGATSVNGLASGVYIMNGKKYVVK